MNLDLSTTATTPFSGAFSMGTSKRPNLWGPSQSPGPAAYNLDSYQDHKSPQWKLGKSNRKPLFQSTGAPPPGSYNLPSMIGSGPKYQMQGTWHNKDDQKPLVGPGSYNPKILNSKSSAPSFSFSSKYVPEQQMSNEDNPGPGTYEVKGNNQKATKQNLGFGLSDRRPLHENATQILPGPGEYSQTLTSKAKESSIRFPKGKRFQLSKIDEDAPGPGSFDISRSFSEKKIPFSFGSKYKTDFDPMKTPGPGTYESSAYNKFHQTNVNFGNSYRNDFLCQNKNPGPGHYDVNDVSLSQDPRVTNRGFGLAKRNKFGSDQSQPGPGQYDIKSTLGEGPKYKIRFKNQDKLNLDKALPGPGLYDVKDEAIRKNAPKAILATKPNDSFSRDQTYETPGPGSYSIENFKHIGPKYTFGGNTKTKLDYKGLFEPCPGSYEIKSTIAGVPNYMKQDKSELKL